MKGQLNHVFFWILLFTITKIYAVEPLPPHLIHFESPQGVALLKKDLNVNTLKLLSHFTTQKTGTYCGAATAVMVLNAVGIAAPIDAQHLPYHYFNQDNFFNHGVQNIITPATVLKAGITLTQLSRTLQSYGLKVTPFYANHLHVNEFRNLLKKAIVQHKFIIVNFSRTALQQKGGGHHSPIAAYDEQEDLFLLLDVARYKYPAYWVKTNDLWAAVNTKDTDTYRGVLIVSSL